MTAEKFKNYSDEKLIEDYNYIVQCYNDFTSKGDIEFANNMMSRIPDFKNELIRRNLIDSDIRQNAPKQEAKPQTAPSSQAITKQAVQTKPKEVVHVTHAKAESVKQSPPKPKEKIQLNGIYREKAHLFETANLRRKHQQLERKLQTAIKQWHGLKNKDKRKEKYRLLIKKRLGVLVKFIDEFAVPAQKKYLLERKISSWIKGGEDVPLNDNLFKIIGSR